MSAKRRRKSARRNPHSPVSGPGTKLPATEAPRSQHRRLQPLDALALSGGLILPFAFSPYFYWYLSLLSLVALFRSCAHCSPGRAAWRAWLFGLGSFGYGIAWIHESFQFSHISIGIAVVLTALFVAFLSSYLSIGAYLVTRFSSPSSWTRLVLVWPGVWVLTEWLRGVLFSGFGWLQLGYAQVDGRLNGWFPIMGVYGVGLIVALSAGIVCWLLSSPRPAMPRSARMIFLGVISAWALPGLAPTGEPDANEQLSVALVQGNVPQDQKWLPQMLAPTLERYLGETRANWDADLIVWPETAVPVYHRHLSSWLKEVSAQAKSNNSQLMFGLPMRVDGRPRNAMASLGNEQGRYLKRHLVPFGEFLPLPFLLQPVVDALGITVSNFYPGPVSQAGMMVKGRSVGVSICYEIAFGDEIRVGLPEAQLLITVSNDAWFGSSIGPHQHLQMARARAMETDRYLLRATNTGITAVIAPDGAIKGRLEQFQAGTLTSVVSFKQTETHYAMFGDMPAVFLSGLLLVFAALLRTDSSRPDPAAV